MQEPGVPRSLKERQRLEREKLILEVAQAVLMEKGYHETSMDEIAAEVGISKGTLYSHFASKEELIQKLLEDKLQSLREIAEQIALRNETAETRLQAMMRFMYLDLYGMYFRLIYSLFNSVEFHALLHAGRIKEPTLFQSISNIVMGLFEEGKEAGEFDRSIPTRVMLGIFFSMMSPMAYKRLVVVDATCSPQELVEDMQRVFFKGIAADSK
jgi:AcrR family transcriptional regulator